MDIIKYVRKDGTGDYTDIFSGFNEMLASGILASGDILSYSMIVDGGTYSGSFSGYIPYTGIFNIYSSGRATLVPTSLSIVSGIYMTQDTPNLYLENFLIDSNGSSNYFIKCNDGISLGLKDVEFINCDYGINLSGGGAVLDNVSSNGSGLGYFIYGSGNTYLNNTKISDYGTGIYCNNIQVSDSYIFNNNININCPLNHTISLSKSLVYGGNYGIYSNSGYMYCYDSTISSTLPIYSISSYCSINSCILSGNICAISGTYASGSILQDSCFYPTGYYGTSSKSKISCSDPKFNNPTIGDYRLKFIQSPYIEYVNNTSYASGVTVNLEERQFRIYNDRGVDNTLDPLKFIYRRGSTILFSDYNQEIKFSSYYSRTRPTRYEQISNIKFSEYDVITKSSFSLDESMPDESPWDWDLIDINTPKIVDNYTYLIPKSFIDIEPIITKNIKSSNTDNIWNNISKKNITVYDQEKYKGLSFDPKLSDNYSSIIWVIDGCNQTLIKQNAFSGQTIEKYPLMTPQISRKTVFTVKKVFFHLTRSKFIC